MPSGSKKRPDTLELEVLGAHHIDSSDDEKSTKTFKIQISQSNPNPNPKPKPSPIPKQDTRQQPSQATNAEEQKPNDSNTRSMKRWFHFARKSRRKNLLQSPNSERAVTTCLTVNSPVATLAKPETPNIANSTNTILASPLQASSIDKLEVHLPDVADVSIIRENSKRSSSKSITESFYDNINNGRANEIHFYPSQMVDNDFSDSLWTSNAKADLSFAESTSEKLLTTSSPIKISEDTADGFDQSSVKYQDGWLSWLLSVFGKLSFWKSRNYEEKNKRSSKGSHDAFMMDSKSHLTSKKTSKASVDFERPRGTDIGNAFRRISQIRRRRSSYYFSDNERRIRANDREFNAQFKYTDNYIKTSKYTLLTFLPFNLLEQFQRLANFYFLCLLVLQLIPAISSLTPVTTAIPLIGVLTLTAVKDAYDDIQRHLSDSQVNNRKSKTLRNGKLVDEKWSGVQVGDLIRLDNNQFVAADILILSTSEPNGLCFIETAELDGETNLKCKQCLIETTELGQRHDLLWNFNGEILCEKPNNLLNKFEGTLIWKNQRFSLDNEKILLRGCVLRNTQWCYGVVIFAGEDTKLMQNSGKTQFKSTGVDRLLNYIIIGIVLFLISICAFFTLACAIWEGLIGQHFQVFLPWENIIPKDIAQGATVIGLLVFFSYAIVLNTVVPISLYVSVEVIRFVQSFLINWDEEMYYDRTKTHAKARTTTLNEELGQIQYIFSDKTGTLTQNIMTFNKCSINGRTYGDIIDLRTGEVIEIDEQQKSFSNSSSGNFKHNKTNDKTISNFNKNESTESEPPIVLYHEAEVHIKKTKSTSITSPEMEETFSPTFIKANKPILVKSSEVNRNPARTPTSPPSTSQAVLSPSLTSERVSDGVVLKGFRRINFEDSFEYEKSDETYGKNENEKEKENDDSAANLSKKQKTLEKLLKKNVNFTSSVKAPYRRTLSTLSKSDEDKVMILDELATTNATTEIITNTSSLASTSSTSTVPPHYSNTFHIKIIPKESILKPISIDLKASSALETPTEIIPKTMMVVQNSHNKSPTTSIVPIPANLSTSSLTSISSLTIKNATHTSTNPSSSIASPNQQKLPSNGEVLGKKKKILKRQSSSSFWAPFRFFSYEGTAGPSAISPNITSANHTTTKDKKKSTKFNVVQFKEQSTSTTQPSCQHCFKQNNTKQCQCMHSLSHNNQDQHQHVNHQNHQNHHQHQKKVHSMEPIDFSANPEYEPEFRWYDHTLLDAVRSDEAHAHNFFRLLALCHTVMPEYVEGRLEYQAQSPDESALVSAARNFGFVFRSRTPNSITIEVMGRTEEYELLSILDFNNIRKRMSVIVKRGNNIVLYCKGADNVIYDRLASSQDEIKNRTQDHLNKFAGEGLRTLVLAERRLDETYYEDWRQRHLEASVSLQNREDKLNAMYEEIESDMALVGVTAIEDKLQDGVPQTIANLQMAGIKIWVLTGDKQETAINIGYSCQLLTDELADVFIVDGNTMEEVEKQLRQFKESIKIVNRFRPVPPHAAVNANMNNYSDSRLSSSLSHSVAFRQQQASPPPPPAISVVTFRWDDKIKHNKGEPDSAECNEYEDNLEKGIYGRTEAKDDDLSDENSFAIVVSGHSLVYCLSPELEDRFLDVASHCKAVICCRVTPLQKALVVELIKRAKHAVTLAIGDGANDVSMIKAAHIGVGISGQEGLQAVLASDYSIAQFRFLERLLLVHGRWSYYRMCKFLRYFFYKNFAFTLCHCWYSFFCGFSAQTVFDPMFISVYNLFYTSLPVLALGVFEQDVSDKHSIEYPKLYTPGLKSELFNIREFVYSVMHGCFSSLILFLIPYGTYKEGVSPNGYILSDHMTLGAVVASILIIDNTAQIALYTSYWTIFNHITIWGSLIWYFVLDYFYNYVIGGPYVGSLTQAMQDLTFWATMLITVVVIMAPVLAYKFYLLDVHPQLSDKIRLKRKMASLRSRQTADVVRTPSARRARRSLRSGYAFAHQEGFGRLITSGKIMRKLPQEFAFPLGLGSKKIQNNVSASAPNTNNNNAREYKNTSTGELNGYGNGIRGTNSADFSPRAPCQDLDTINL